MISIWQRMMLNVIIRTAFKEFFSMCDRIMCWNSSLFMNISIPHISSRMNSLQEWCGREALNVILFCFVFSITSFSWLPKTTTRSLRFFEYFNKTIGFFLNFSYGTIIGSLSPNLRNLMKTVIWKRTASIHIRIDQKWSYSVRKEFR